MAGELRGSGPGAADQKIMRGRCLCGAVTFELAPPIDPIVACHCRQCHQWSGNYVVATRVPAAQFTLLSGADTMRWYRSSDIAERAFCATCGSSLFWRTHGGENISIMAGCLEAHDGVALSHHIFVGDQPSFYDIVDGLPQHDASDT